MPDDLDARIVDSLASDARLALASLVRILGNLDRAEDALQDAVGEALTAWRARGIPDDPRAWLVTVGRRRAIDATRRARRGAELVAEHYADAEPQGAVGPSPPDSPAEILRDDPLRLLFTCCHPAVPMEGRVALALKVVCGLETDEIARAFLVGEAAMKRRISRAKAFVRDRRLPYRVPTGDELAERLPAVLAVIYLLYNEGHSATAGVAHLRRRIAGHALALARMVAELLPASEAVALLALLLLHESRADARTDADGEIVPLDRQDRSRWDPARVDEGTALTWRCVQAGPLGYYGLQAAIAAVHASAPTVEATRWDLIVGYYDMLLDRADTPTVRLNRAIAIAMRDGPAAGIALVRPLVDGPLARSHGAYAALGELHRRAGDREAARTAYVRALEHVRQAPERRHLERALSEFDSGSSNVVPDGAARSTLP